MTEIMVTRTKKPTISFVFVSDDWTVDQVKKWLEKKCDDLKIDKPTAFNSTGDVRLGSVLQYYRGDTAAILLPGYEDAKNLTGDPPFPQSMNADTWRCVNKTIGDSIPLMDGPVQGWSNWAKYFVGFGCVIVLLLCYLAYKFLEKSSIYRGIRDYFKRSKGDRFTPSRERKRGHRERPGLDQQSLGSPQSSTYKYDSYYCSSGYSM